jgi:NAD-dependent SIR2 family protein deacetylase
MTVDPQVRPLARYMADRKKQGESPYLLVLGAGVSLPSGARSGGQVVAGVVAAHGSETDVDGMTWDQKLEAFYAILDQRSRDERYALLKPYVEGTAPSAGYQALAELARAGYFEVILSTNYDTLLEDALAGAGLRRGDMDVLINGVHDEDEIVRQLGRRVPAIKVVKLHGDLYHRLFAFTPEEIMQFSAKIERLLHELLRADLIVCGHSMRDLDVNRCLDRQGDAVWYVNPSAPSPMETIYQILRARPGHVVAGEMGTFDRFFAALRDLLLPSQGQG